MLGCGTPSSSPPSQGVQSRPRPASLAATPWRYLGRSALVSGGQSTQTLSRKGVTAMLGRLKRNTEFDRPWARIDNEVAPLFDYWVNVFYSNQCSSGWDPIQP